MKIRVLGCSGSETPGRNLSCFLLDGRVLFDAGSATSTLGIDEQMKLEAVFLTHAHLDHVRAVPFLADNIFFKRKGSSIKVAALPFVLKNIKKHLLNGVIWPDFTSIPSADNPVLEFMELREGNAYRIKKYSVTPYRVSHSIPAAGYLVEDGKGKSFFYSGDTGPARQTWKRLGSRERKRPLDCLLIEVSLPDRMEKEALELGHLTPSLLKKELEAMDRPPSRICVTHIKPFFTATIKRELKKLGIKGLSLLVEGEEITV